MGSPVHASVAPYSWGHRPHLTGLRVPAVYLVVAFHAGVGAFSGGFIGVDLFFVLSGFLVCHVLLEELDEHGKVRFARFYARRFRRLLPAALVAIAGTAALFMAVASPLERADLVDDARAALLYFANWHYVAEASDYFADDGGAASPFVHFWSLSVEEQYYFVFPVLLVGAVALTRRRPTLLPLVLLIPLAASLIRQFTLDDTVHAYYGTDARVYQPLAGAALAAWLRARRRPFAGPVGSGSVLGVAAIALLFVAASDAADGLSASSRGLLATIVSIGIVGALESTPTGLPARMLSGRAVRYLGDISYGTYLWHWPVILATERVLEIGPVAMAFTAAIVSTALAALSHEIVERPFRVRSRLDRIPRSVAVGGLALSVVTALWAAPALLRTDGGPLVQRPAGGVDPEELALITAELEAADEPEDDRSGALTPGVVETPAAPDGDPAAPDGDPAAPDGDPAAPDGSAEPTATPEAAPPAPSTPIDPDDLDLVSAGERQALYACFDGAPDDCVLRRGNGVHIHVIGDSHAAALVPAFQRIAEDGDLTLSATTMGSCPWQAGLTVPDPDTVQPERCRIARADAYDRVIPALDPDIVVVTARALDSPYWLEERDPPFADDPAVTGDPWQATTRATLGALIGDGRTVVIVEPLPEARGFDPLDCLSGADTVADCAFIDDGGRLASERFLRGIAETTLGVATIDLDPIVCPELPICPAEIGGVVVRSDGHHLSKPFAEAVAPEIALLLRAAGAIPATP